jgi:hypothetical protein
MKDIGRLPYPIICYCATCKREWGWGRNEFLGFEFTCPEERGRKHLARLVLEERPAFWWLRFEWLLYLYQTRISLVPLLNRALRSCGCKWEAEHHTVLWLVALAIALITESYYGQSVTNYAHYFLSALFVWRLVDIVLVNVSITFTSKFPANRLRTVILTFAGYIQMILVYAYLYAVFGKSWFLKCVTAADAVYFSFGTTLTVGYGNLEPTYILPRSVVVSELMLGLFFVVIVIAQVAAWANQPQHSNGEFSLDVVRIRPDDHA